MIVIDSKENLLKSDDEEDLIFDHSTLLHKDLGKDVANREPGYRCCPSGGKLQIAKTVNLCLSFFGLGLCFAIPTATLTDLQTAVQANENIKNIYTARYSGYLFGAIIGGFLFDCYNRQFLLFLSLLATGIGIIIMPFCQELPALMACTAVTGITMGFLDTGGNVWCLDLWGRRSAPFMQALHFCFGMGAFIAPLVAEPFLSPLSGHLNNSSLENSTFLNGSLLSVPRVGLPQYPLISSKHIIVKHSLGDFDNSFQLLNEFELDRTKRDVSSYNESEWANNNNTTAEIFISPDYNSTETSNKTDNFESEIFLKKTSVISTTLSTITTTTVKPKPKFADGNKLPKNLKWTKPPMDKSGNPVTPSSKPLSMVVSSGTSANSSKMIAPTTTLAAKTSTTDIGYLNTTFGESKETTEASKTTEGATTLDVPSHLTDVTSTETATESSFKPTVKIIVNEDDKSSQTARKKLYDLETKTKDQDHSVLYPTQAFVTSTISKVNEIEPISTMAPESKPKVVENIKISSSTNSLSFEETPTKEKPSLKQPLMMKQSTKFPEPTTNPDKVMMAKKFPITEQPRDSIISSLKINMPDPQNEMNVSETNQNESVIWDNDILSTVFDFLHKNRLGKFEIPYILLAVYIFFVAIVFLVFLCKNPREPRSMQLEETNKSRDVSLSFRVIMVGLMSLFLCLYVGIEVGVGELLETFATTENLPQSRGYFLPYLFWGSFAVSRGYSIFVATRVSGQRMLIANLSVCLVASIMLVAGADKLEALLWIGVILLGLSYGPLFPTSISWLENYLHITNKTASIFILGAAVGEIVIPIIIDLFINQEPMVLMYVNVIVSALCFISFIVLCVMASKHKKYGGKKPNRAMYELANTHDYDDSSELLSSANNDHNNKSTTNGYYLLIKNRSVSGNGSEYSRISET